MLLLASCINHLVQNDLQYDTTEPAKNQLFFNFSISFQKQFINFEQQHKDTLYFFVYIHEFHFFVNSAYSGQSFCLEKHSMSKTDVNV